MRFNLRAVCIFYLLSFLTSYSNGEAKWRTSMNDRDNRNYCRICPNHTMCLFPSDCESTNCIDMNNSLDEEDIEILLDNHNLYRVLIASGKECRGNPGPQPAAKTMMELIWDDELAVIARRWALQCKLFEKDQCRDVERFGVWQNVNVLDMDIVGNNTSRERIHFHVMLWYDEVEDFDNAQVGLVNYSAWQFSSYIPLASAMFIYVGCGRAIYTLDLNKTAAMPGEFGNRVEVLVCNYGPVDRTAPHDLYELGQPGQCPFGTVPSDRYQFLCRALQDSPFLSKSTRRLRNKQQISNRISSVVCIVSLSQLLLFYVISLYLIL